MSKLLSITAPHFCAGIVVGERAAPILRYMVGWSEARIRAYARAKGWTVEPPLDSDPAKSP